MIRTLKYEQQEAIQIIQYFKESVGVERLCSFFIDIIDDYKKLLIAVEDMFGEIIPMFLVQSFFTELRNLDYEHMTNKLSCFIEIYFEYGILGFVACINLLD